MEEMRADRPGDGRVNDYLGINYDTCHLAVEFEEPAIAIGHLSERGIRISKIHLSSALAVRPTEEVRRALTAFADDTYLHQVIVREQTGVMRRYRDLNEALAQPLGAEPGANEWRIHFHIPLHSPPTSHFGNTVGHLLGVLDLLAREPAMCSHLEMETYTWEVMPQELKNRNVVDQLVAEYRWTLKQLAARGLNTVAL